MSAVTTLRIMVPVGASVSRAVRPANNCKRYEAGSMIGPVITFLVVVNGICRGAALLDRLLHQALIGERLIKRRYQFFQPCLIASLSKFQGNSRSLSVSV
jgi:hypothetical protein